MKIKNISVKEFKRFENLTIENLGSEVKLVVLVGPNGSGKTSLFEAFNYVFNVIRQSTSFDDSYHVKVGTANPIKNWSDLYRKIKIETHDGIDLAAEQNKPEAKKRFYFRTAYRHEPDFTVSSINRQDSRDQDSKHPAMLISSESRVSDNYQRIVSETVAEIYNAKNDQHTKAQIRDRLIGKIKNSLKKVFDDLDLEGPGDPLQNGTFFFSKGTSKNFKYKNLSGGEKAAFDLLLDYGMRVQSFDNTVFCIDEPEIHMHTRLQAKLLNEIFDLTPERCQLWISTHSIGMLREAQRLYKKDPNKVAFLDFHDLDFDKTVVLKPTTPNREFYKRMFSVAIDELAELVAPQTIYFCEGRLGSDKGNKPFGFDPRAYRTIFNNQKPEVEFASLGGDKEVTQISKIISSSLKHVLPGVNFYTLFDRDDRSEDEILEAKKLSQKVLKRRDLENYLWDDEILTKLCSEKTKTELATSILNKKSELLKAHASQGKAADDIKAISGLLYNFVKQELQLTQCGNDAVNFAVVTLAPLITPETAVYKLLENDLFG